MLGRPVTDAEAAAMGVAITRCPPYRVDGGDAMAELESSVRIHRMLMRARFDGRAYRDYLNEGYHRVPNEDRGQLQPDTGEGGLTCS